MSASTNTAPHSRAASRPSVRALIVRHKLLSLAALVVVLGFVALIVAEALSAGSLKVSDTTSCSAWSSATQRQQTAYAGLYVSRHGPLANGASDAASIEEAINSGCIEAYSYDEADTVTVLQAINHQY